MSLAVQDKVKTAVRIRRDLMKAFQGWVKRGFGKLKGAQEIALNDAIKVWVSLAEGDVDVWFGYVETVNGLKGYRALLLDEVLNLIPSLRLSNLRIIQGSMRPPILRKLLELKPDMVMIMDGYEVRDIEDPKGMFNDLFKQVMLKSDVELCLVWSRERRAAFFSRERFSLGGEVEYSLAVKRLHHTDGP